MNSQFLQRGADFSAVLALRSAFWRRSWRHRLGSHAVFAAYCYLGVFLVLLALENRFLFHPLTAAQDWLDPPAGLHVEDVELTSADGTRLHAWWSAPADWRPEQGALLYCHGNAGNLSHRGEGVRRWQDLMKTAVLIFDYPGYGRSEGRPTEAGCYAAADSAYDHLTGARGVSAGRVLLYGGSLGGAIATDLAVRRPHRALILVSTFTSIPDMAQRQFPWLPARWCVRNRLDNLAKIGRCPSPVFLAHGTADRVVPFAHGERLFAAAPEPKQFFPMPGYDHNHTPGPDFYTAVREFLEKAEATRPGPARRNGPGAASPWSG